MANTWPQKLHSREIGASSLPAAALPKPNGGVLILNDQLTIYSLPGGLLNHIASTDGTTSTSSSSSTSSTASPIHYLDLGGIQARSLLDFGGTDEFWENITKLYASNSGFTTIDGVSKLSNCRYLYLDNSNLPKEELLKLIHDLPASLHHRIVTLDLSNNPGYDEEVETALLASPLFAVDDGNCFLNGKKIQR